MGVASGIAVQVLVSSVQVGLWFKLYDSYS